MGFGAVTVFGAGVAPDLSTGMARGMGLSTGMARGIGLRASGVSCWATSGSGARPSATKIKPPERTAFHSAFEVAKATFQIFASLAGVEDRGDVAEGHTLIPRAR